MQQVIEATLELPDGIADCRFELMDADTCLYNVTILYPQTINGFTRSEIFTYDMVRDNGSKYIFDHTADIHPKILKLETQLSNFISSANT